MSAWTQPYLGVQHLETDRYLCTVTDWETFSDLTIYRKPIRISEAQDHTFYGPGHLEKAKNYCESEIK